MGKIELGKDFMFSFLYNDCGISLPVVEKFVFEDMWDNKRTFFDNSENCRELELKMLQLYKYKVIVKDGDKKPYFKLYNSLEEANLYLIKYVTKKFDIQPYNAYDVCLKFDDNTIIKSKVIYNPKEHTCLIKNQNNEIITQYMTDDITEAFYISMKFIRELSKNQNIIQSNIYYGYYSNTDYEIKIEYTNNF